MNDTKTCMVSSIMRDISRNKTMTRGQATKELVEIYYLRTGKKL
jgi:hypothetical protein